MVFLDEKDMRIHATIKKNLIMKFKELVKEGETYMKNTIKREAFAEQIDAYVTNADQNEPTVVILQCFRAKTYCGSTSLSNVRHGSQLLIEPNLKEVLDYMLALSEEVYVSSVCVGSVLAKILEIESTANWWYASCKNCVRKVEPVSNKYWCEECDGFVPAVPRVQVSAIDSTGSTSFVMFDRIVMQLIGKSASELLGGASNKKLVPEILSIGDGTIGDPNEGVVSIEIPDDLLIKESADPLASIVNETYPSFLENMDDISYLQHRAILAPTNEIVDVVNDYMLSLVPKEMKTYLSFDSTCSANRSIDRPDDIHTPEFLNTVNSSGLPNHELKLKEGVPAMFLRNIDQSSGWCNGTRLSITRLGNRVLEAKIISGTNIVHKVFIPRLTLTPSDNMIPFKFKRRQFPITLSFAMTVNKSQGQSLQHVGIYLQKPVFSHGQLYVAISRVTSRRGLKILICNNEGNTSNTTTNVVYKEVFQNLN
ncbi:PREDICTED: uncharacterized protein LOC105959688 [Erythranthe guttata]|uniref:uncharacterized protein LOC105959688 n=1 Tax=Erythranthe guttata TaxID=4155 RepID=UPI00064DB687|nr:PREDICTED: uncharacterized protein LOC105959688 [Erythranthe guttata]|eukprot:XP_012839282.1 PREDICTED: uncharacterized protein LOC105959688 [Erythranthe guttata]